MGHKVMLKPHIDLVYDSNRTLWRGDIGRGMTAGQWQAWFASYTKFILKYAKLAQE